MSKLSIKVFKQEVAMITPEYFKFLDFWFYTIGVNVWPADTKNKRLSNSWKARQDEPMSSDEYEAMKKKGDYIRGAAVITGKVWRGDYVGYYLNGVDLDNKNAIQEVCYSFKGGRIITPEELADQTLVEHHLDDPTKIHLYVYSKHPFKNKTSDAGKAWFNKQPAIEVKGTKSLMFCTPSMHKSGHRYQFIKQNIPGISDNLEEIIHDILSKYDIEYLSKSDKGIRERQRSNDESRTVNEGSRHTELLREMNAKLHEHIRMKSLEEIRQLCIAYNNLYCNPPLPSVEFEHMWDDAVVYVTQKELEKENEAMGASQGMELISIADAIRRSSGKVAVKGMIIGLSSVEQVITCTEMSCSSCSHSDSINHNPPLFSLPYYLSLAKTRKCPECGQSAYGPSKHHEKSAIIIQMQDEEKQNALESLNVVLFEGDTFNIRNGEKAMALGELHVVQQRGNSKRITYLFANAGIEYERPENTKVVITEEDLSRLYEFVKQPENTAS